MAESNSAVSANMEATYWNGNKTKIVEYLIKASYLGLFRIYKLY